MKPIRIAVVGLGKIARDQHLPAIDGNERFELAATVEPSNAPDAMNFASCDEMLQSVENLEAVAITTPPTARYAIACACLDAGLHVLLEKPPTVTLAEIEDLRDRAVTRGLSLFTAWHAQHNPAVLEAEAILRGRRVERMTIVWHEDVDKWHPGQRWIWDAGGFGVFDPGINAFSIVSKIFPAELIVRSAGLTFPEGAETPIAAEIRFESSAIAGSLECSLDWRRSAGEEWTIEITTDVGTIALVEGGSRLLVDGQDRPSAGLGEYPDIYRRFAELIERRESQIDMVPLRLVADCLLVGSRA